MSFWYNSTARIVVSFSVAENAQLFRIQKCVFANKTSARSTCDGLHSCDSICRYVSLVHCVFVLSANSSHLARRLHCCNFPIDSCSFSHRNNEHQDNVALHWKSLSEAAFNLKLKPNQRQWAECARSHKWNTIKYVHWAHSSRGMSANRFRDPVNQITTTKNAQTLRWWRLKSLNLPHNHFGTCLWRRNICERIYSMQ